jgi:hypothetical protein
LPYSTGTLPASRPRIIQTKRKNKIKSNDKITVTVVQKITNNNSTLINGTSIPRAIPKIGSGYQLLTLINGTSLPRAIPKIGSGYQFLTLINNITNNKLIPINNITNNKLNYTKTKTRARF